MEEKDQLEEKLLQRLTEGEMEQHDPEQAAVDRLPAKHEVRIQTEYDPVAEETKIVRKHVREIDGRYDHK